MAFIVEDGTIVAGATSYVSVIDFVDYWEDRNSAPTGKDEEVEAALIVATQFVDLQNKWKGSIVQSSQALDWPRKGVVDNEGRMVSSITIPIQLRNAVCEYAFRQLTTPIAPDQPASGEVISQRDKLGQLETETRYAEGTQPITRSYPLADKWLIGLTSSLGLGQLSRCV